MLISRYNKHLEKAMYKYTFSFISKYKLRFLQVYHYLFLISIFSPKSLFFKQTLHFTFKFTLNS